MACAMLTPNGGDFEANADITRVTPNLSLYGLARACILIGRRTALKRATVQQHIIVYREHLQVKHYG